MIRSVILSLVLLLSLAACAQVPVTGGIEVEKCSLATGQVVTLRAVEQAQVDGPAPQVTWQASAGEIQPGPAPETVYRAPTQTGVVVITATLRYPGRAPESITRRCAVTGAVLGRVTPTSVPLRRPTTSPPADEAAQSAGSAAAPEPAPTEPTPDPELTPAALGTPQTQRIQPLYPTRTPTAAPASGGSTASIIIVTPAPTATSAPTATPCRNNKNKCK